MSDVLNGVSVFVAAAESGGFSAAAAKLHLSRSAVGKTIAKLEEQLGVRLFHRSTRAIRLTHEGEMFLDRCRHVLGELEAAEAELSHTTASPRGRLRVGLPFAGDLLTPLFGAFQASYPEIELDLDYNDRLVDVIEDGFDAVIRSGEASDSRLMQVRLGDFSTRLVAAPSYLARRGMPRTPADLLNHRLLHHRFTETGKLADWELALPDGMVLPVALTASSLDPLICLAVAGHGIAALPTFMIADRLKAGTLREVLPGARRRRRALRVIWPRSSFPVPKVSVFVKFMTESLKNVLHEDAK